jgi:hypothetical protein
MPLPEKDCFTLDEVLERWRISGCDRATLLHYAREDLLVFSVYLRDIGSHRSTHAAGDGAVEVSEVTTFHFRSPGFQPQPIRYLSGDDARRVLEGHDGETIAVRVLFSSPIRDKASATGYSPAKFFEYSDLLVSRSERDRFERRHAVRRQATRIGNVWRWVTDSENRGALSAVLAVVTAVITAAWALFRWWLE